MSLSIRQVQPARLWPYVAALLVSWTLLAGALFAFHLQHIRELPQELASTATGVALNELAFQRWATEELRAVAASYGGIWLVGLFGIGAAGRAWSRHERARVRYEEGLTCAKEELQEANTQLAAGMAHREKLSRQVEQILQFAGESILGVNPSGQITRANLAAEMLLGYGQGELNGFASTMVLAAGEEDPVARALADGTIQQRADATFCRRDGSTLRVQLICTPMRDENSITGAVISFKDVTAQRESELAAERLRRALATVGQCSEALIRAESEQALLNSVCRAIVETGGFAAAWVGLAEDDEMRTVRPVMCAGLPADLLSRVQISWRADLPTGQGPAGEAIRTREVQIVKDVNSESRFEPWRAQLTPLKMGASIALPLLQNGLAFGVLCVYAREVEAFDPKEASLLTGLANDLAYGIRMQRTTVDRDVAQEALEKVLLQTIQAISLTVEKRDPYTAGHQLRVGELAEALGERMGLDKERIQGLRLGAIIHDIGKIYIPAEILSRPGRLSPVEFNLIKTHPQVGHEIVEGVEFPWAVKAMILQHHERMDGSGYPFGLKGEEIALEARILAVADVVEAISAHRPYRAALGMEPALAEIRSGRGRLYDPVVVDACLALFEQGHFHWQ